MDRLAHLYVHYTCPVSGKPTRAPRSSRVGRAILAGDMATVEQMARDYDRMAARQVRVAELRGPEGETIGRATIARYAQAQGRTFVAVRR